MRKLAAFKCPTRNACACTFHNNWQGKESETKYRSVATHWGQDIENKFILCNQNANNAFNIWTYTFYSVLLSQQLLHGCVLLYVLQSLFDFGVWRGSFTLRMTVWSAQASVHVFHSYLHLSVCVRITLQMLQCIVLTVFHVTLPSTNCSLLSSYRMGNVRECNGTLLHTLQTWWIWCTHSWMCDMSGRTVSATLVLIHDHTTVLHCIQYIFPVLSVLPVPPPHNLQHISLNL